MLALKPLIATQVGNERFDDQLPDLTDDGREKSLAVHREALADAEGFAPESLGREDRATLAMVKGLAQPRSGVREPIRLRAKGYLPAHRAELRWR